MNRTHNALRATMISFIAALFIGALTFIRTSVILSRYGVEVNSVTQIAYQILSYLALLETGIGAAYLFKMYLPFSKNDYNGVSRLVSGLRQSLKRVAIIMLVVLLTISIVYPLFIKKYELDYFTVGLIIILIGLRLIIPYYCITYQKSIIQLHEKQYQVIVIDSIINVMILIIEIVFMLYTKANIIIVLSIGVIFMLISYLIYRGIIVKTYKNIDIRNENYDFSATRMTKHIIIHQISSLTNSKIDTILLSFFNLFQVTVYAAYDAIITYPIGLIVKIIDSLRASMGIKFMKGDSNTYSVFNQILSLTFFVASTTTIIFLMKANDFVDIWIGNQFTLGILPIFLFGALLFNRLVIFSIYLIRDANGLYKESKKYTIIATILNLVLSLLLVKSFGIVGLLSATLISNLLVLNHMNISLIYKVVFKKINLFYIRYILVVFITISVYSIFQRIFITFSYFDNDMINFVIDSVIRTIIISAIIYAIFILFDRDFRKLNVHGYNVLKNLLGGPK